MALEIKPFLFSFEELCYNSFGKRIMTDKELWDALLKSKALPISPI